MLALIEDPHTAPPQAVDAMRLRDQLHGEAHEKVAMTFEGFRVKGLGFRV